MQDFKDIHVPLTPGVMQTSVTLQSGPPIQPLARLITYEPAEWETFVEEWVSGYLQTQYKKVLKFAGANDRGIDVAGFEDNKHLMGVWDNYQCKHYDNPIAPSKIWSEIGKTLWHSFNKHYVPPRAYYFVAPKGTGTKLTQLLANSAALKAQLIEVWNDSVRDEITSTQQVLLEGEFKDYVDKFDFSIFQPTSMRQIIEQHRTTPYFIPRFGGGLPVRPKAQVPPIEINDHESGYITKLLDAYADHKKVSKISAEDLQTPLKDHFDRQRECFYHAESLRVFVRDKVEPGTFESLQEEIYHGVIDTAEAPHEDGFECVKAVTNAAHFLPVDGHALGGTTQGMDKRGICHQLANEDKLKWKK